MAHPFGLAGSPFGRALLSVGIAVVMAAMIVPNLPESEVENRLESYTAPVTDVLGIRQGWAVFSPNPTTISVVIEATVAFDDGSVEFWRVPRGGPVLDAVRSERWRQVEAKLRLDDFSSRWVPFSRWLGAELSTPDRTAESVALARIVANTPPVGSGLSHHWERITFHRMDLTTGAVDRTESEPIEVDAP